MLITLVLFALLILNTYTKYETMGAAQSLMASGGIPSATPKANS
jgi:hypothetical protein